MKRIFGLMIISCALLFASCESGNDEPKLKSAAEMVQEIGLADSDKTAFEMLSSNELWLLKRQWVYSESGMSGELIYDSETWSSELLYALPPDGFPVILNFYRRFDENGAYWFYEKIGRVPPHYQVDEMVGVEGDVIYAKHRVEGYEYPVRVLAYNGEWIVLEMGRSDVAGFANVYYVELCKVASSLVTLRESVNYDVFKQNFEKQYPDKDLVEWKTHRSWNNKYWK